MKFPSLRWLASITFIATSLLISGCNTLPRSGPNEQEVLAGTTAVRGGTKNIVFVTEQIAQATRLNTASGFPSSFQSAGRANYDTISAGDTLNVTVWENVDNGLLGSLGQRQTQLPPTQVSQSGKIFVPYVGSVQAAGRSTDALRRDITNALASQTPDPQVEVFREVGDGATISIVGTAGAQGIQRLGQANNSLLAAIANAGGTQGDPAATQVRVVRGNQAGTVQLQDLYDNPNYDIAMRSGDRITVQADRRFYTMLGAGGSQNLTPFNRADVNALDAFAESGGLSGATSDPTGIFVFRAEDPRVASRLFPNQQFSGPTEMVYVLDLTAKNGIFVARNFQIRDRDTIYVTEAPLVTWTKSLSVFTSALTSSSNFEGAVSALSN